MALKGIKVIEMLGLAPGPLCGTMLADFGAAVTVVQKIDPDPFYIYSNGKKMISLNLKTKEGIKILKKMCASSDVLLDTFRPGVLEKFGLAPQQLLEENSRLVYARITGYGQTGSYKEKGGHDINYIAMSGLLSMLSKNKEPPVPPLNLIADFAGGSLTCFTGILLALLQRSVTGKGQIVDCSMSEASAYLGSWIFKSQMLPIWLGEPGTNVLDGGCPFYMTYKTKDGKYMAVGALEPQFYANFLKGLQLSEDDYGQTSDAELCKKKFQEVFITKTQEEWCIVFENLDACVTPVLDMDTVDKHTYHKTRNTFYRNSDNLLIPNPAPRLSSTPGVSVGKQPEAKPGQHTIQIMKELGYSDIEINQYIKKGDVYAINMSKL